jgi:hypothetical protein
MFFLAAILAAVMQLQPGDSAICNTGAQSTAAPTAQPSVIPTPKPPLVTGDRLFITQSGVYYVHGEGIKGADIAVSNVTLKNYDITTQSNGNNGYGVYVHGNVNHVKILDNNIHDLCRDGVFMDSNVSYVTIKGNTITRASMSGIDLDGQNDTADANNISETMQYPRRKGGIFAGCSDQSGADADGIRFFGSDHMISNNIIHDIDYGTSVNVDPHVDCFQTWGSSHGPTKNVTINGNHCWWDTTGNDSDNEVSSIEALNGATNNIMYRYNVFQNMRQGINVGKGVGAIIFDHNTVDNVLQEVMIYLGTPGSDSTITNNIFWRHGGGGDEYTTKLGPTISNNNCTGPNGSACGTYPVNAPASALNPMFISVGAVNSPTNDYHLKPNSPTPTMGAFPLQQ